MTNVNERIAELMSEALRAEDAQASGVDAKEILADPDRAVGLLGAPGVLQARHAVVQRFGGVGAILVIACEESWKREHAANLAGLATRSEQLDSFHLGLDQLLHRFGDIGPSEMDCLVEAVETAEGCSQESEDAIARRWLHVMFAVAARDGTDQAHHAYVEALDRVLALKRGLVSIY